MVRTAGTGGHVCRHFIRSEWGVKGFSRGFRPAEDLGGGDVKGFLTDLAVRQGVAASTQNQAFNALLFFYRHVLGREFGKLEGVARAKRRRYVRANVTESKDVAWRRERLF